MITLLLPLILQALITAAGQTIPSYEPLNNIALDCGSQETAFHPSGRQWDGDGNSKFFSLQYFLNNASSVETSTTDRTIDIPYRTARVSAKEFVYMIPVIPGANFIRLHFYAPRLNASMAFSVTAGGYALLSNFSGSPAETEEVVREYIMVVNGSSVKINFTPVPGKTAFVNGIEVVSMPSDLYYTNAPGPGLNWVGQENRYFLRNNTALETMYRVDMGAEVETAPDKDTGMFRLWETEYPYLTFPGYSVTPIILSNIRVNFSLIHNYTAPETVYATARSLGNQKDVMLMRSYNLTWEFPVDPGFSYMLRLHFCEIVKEINIIDDRVFQILIANQTAERAADVIAWTGGKYIPYFRDYVTTVSGKEKKNITLALHASAPNIISKYSDAILNGVEIFKLSNSRRNLSGINPDPIPRHVVLQDGVNRKSPRNKATIGIIFGIASAVILVALVGAFFLLRGRKNYKTSAEGGSDGTAWLGPLSFGTVKSSKTRGSTNLPSDLCRCFSLSEIKAATNNFEDAFIIGVGGFGNVYKGHIDEGTIPVAIKRLKSESSQGAREFKTEIEMLSHLRHRHLVSLIGYCDDRGEMILVYEYMSHGTLRDHLYKSDNPPLTWRRRLEACIGAARGLHYLHAGAKHNVIHRDVKTTNILLDDAWVAKVSDFGLSKAGPTTTSKGHVSTVVKGSFGYLDPEYYRLQQLTEKSDVYSFGVVLCEVLCGRPPILRTAERRPDVNLANWTRSCQRNGTLGEIVDPNLAGKISSECLKKYGEIAVSCMSDNGSDRPSMNDVVWSLEFAMQLQQKAEEGNEDSADDGYFGAGEHHRLVNGNDTDETTGFWENTTEIRSSGVTKISSSEHESATNVSMKVFSEIYDPKAR